MASCIRVTNVRLEELRKKERGALSNHKTTKFMLETESCGSSSTNSLLPSSPLPVISEQPEHAASLLNFSRVSWK